MPATPEFKIDDLKKRMEGAVSSLRHDLAGLRTGRATAALLDPVTVEAYGANVPMNQVASVSAPEPRMLSVQIYDRSMVSAVEKAIRSAGLGLNPIVEGQSLRIPIPPLNEERRRDLARQAGKYAEEARVAIRNVRRDGMEHLKKLEKEGALGQDQSRKLSDQVQKETDGFIKRIDEVLKAKEEEILQV